MNKHNFWQALITAALLTCTQQAYSEVISLTATPRASQTPIIIGVQKHFPDIAKKHGIPNGRVDIAYHRSSADALNLVIKKEKTMTVASLPAIINFNAKNPGVLKFLSMTNVADAYLMCRQDVKSIRDIKDRKLTISITSKHTSPHLIVKNIALQTFGNADALENNIVTMSGQQSQQILMSGTKGLDCALTGVPVQNQLEEAGLKKLYVQGQNTWSGWQNAYVVNQEWAANNPAVVRALLETFQYVTDQFNLDPEPYIKLFIEQEKLEIDSRTLTQHYRKSNNRAITKFSKPVMDMLRFSEQVGFSAANGLIDFEKNLVVDASRL
jgi:ABC-type nitrate/sulfonate/bicarbonate transport system substrate-binding protein